MNEVFRTFAISQRTAGSVIAVHCSDPRFQPHFQDFLRKGLGLRNYALLAVPGGPQLLAPPDSMPHMEDAGWPWMEFMMDLTHTERVILITHSDCRWYVGTYPDAEPARVQQQQLLDLERVQRNLSRRFPSLRAELYYASLEGSDVNFQQI